MAQTQDCERCDGKGHINGYSHVQGGVCFKCAGSGKVAAKRQPSAASLAKKAAKEAQRAVTFEWEKKVSTRAHNWAWNAFGNDPRLVNVSDGFKRAQAYQFWLKAMGRDWQGKKFKKVS